MCDFCQNNCEKWDRSGLDVMDLKGKNLTIIVNDDGAGCRTEFEIEYCPFCGRNLSGKVDLERMTAAENRAYFGIYG